MITRDIEARRAALTGHATSMLIEAGAGTGKTALMAGRIVTALASGVAPKAIVAVSFTERAASELAQRIETMARAVARGAIPQALLPARDVLNTPEARRTVEQALPALGALRSTTLHGLCREIAASTRSARDHAAKQVMDPIATTRMRDRALDRWIAEALRKGRHRTVTALIIDDPSATRTRLEALMERDWTPQLEESRAAETLEEARGHALAQAQALETTLARTPWRESATQTLVAAAIRHCREAKTAPEDLLSPIPDPELLTTTGSWRKLRTKTRWAKAARAGGARAKDGEAAFDAIASAYETLKTAWMAVEAQAVETVRHALCAAGAEARAQWRSMKHTAHVCDFDDLVSDALEIMRNDEATARTIRESVTMLVVDEAQDTDPEQMELVWRIASHGPEETGETGKESLRPGALVLVGDPKQAIYGFRGADVDTYVKARRQIRDDREAQVHAIRTCFRCAREIVDRINAWFTDRLDETKGQPGYIALEAASHAGSEPEQAVRTLTVRRTDDPATPDATRMREEEARTVAEWVDEQIRSGTAPGDIALLTPTGTGVEAYEAAIESRRLRLWSQAGKGLYRCQEIHDLIALTRVIADPTDRIALGALLRGPLCAVDDETLLDASEVVRKARTHEPWLDATVPGEWLAEQPAIREIVEQVQALHLEAGTASPYRIVRRACAAFDVERIVASRGSDPERALANIDRIVERAKAAPEDDLTALARWLDEARERGERVPEGRPDAQREAVALATVHAAKGLEWPIVVMINMMGEPLWRSPPVAPDADGRATLRIMGRASEGYESACATLREAQDRERVRIAYVAATRARDQLVLPIREDGADRERGWARIAAMERWTA